MSSPAQSDAISVSQLLTEVADTTQKTPLRSGRVSNDPFHVNYKARSHVTSRQGIFDKHMSRKQKSHTHF